MDYGNMLGDSFGYARDAVIGKWKEWLLLILATILICIPLLGYTLRVLRGEKPAPEVTGWGTLIVDGIKYFIVSIIRAIACLIVLFLAMGSFLAAIASGKTSSSPACLPRSVLSGSHGPAAWARPSTSVRSLPPSGRSAGAVTSSPWSSWQLCSVSSPLSCPSFGS